MRADFPPPPLPLGAKGGGSSSSAPLSWLSLDRRVSTGRHTHPKRKKKKALRLWREGERQIIERKIKKTPRQVREGSSAACCSVCLITCAVGFLRRRCHHMTQMTGRDGKAESVAFMRAIRATRCTISVKSRWACVNLCESVTWSPVFSNTETIS